MLHLVSNPSPLILNIAQKPVFFVRISTYWRAVPRQTVPLGHLLLFAIGKVRWLWTWTMEESFPQFMATFGWGNVMMKWLYPMFKATCLMEFLGWWWSEGQRDQSSKICNVLMASNGILTSLKVGTKLSFEVTLWLCQNSYWKWLFRVDFPIKHGGSFQFAMLVITRGYPCFFFNKRACCRSASTQPRNARVWPWSWGWQSGDLSCDEVGTWIFIDVDTRYK